VIQTLTTKRLLLRPARPTDLDALWALWTDAEVRRFLWDDRVITRDEAAATLADCDALGAEGLGLWVLEPQAPGVVECDPLGCAGLFPVSTAARYEPRLAGMVEPLVALAPRVWGRGYAQEALGALIAYARAPLGRSRLAAVTDVPNAASDRMLRRAGFIVLGETMGPRYPLRTYLREA
jgi:RimJ/RimL family protein N-acetyltransferase